jgi:hypothetical protein
MVEPIQCYRDSAGRIHQTKNEALLAELQIALGKSGSESSESIVTPGLAALMRENRAALIDILRQFEPDEGETANGR